MSERLKMPPERDFGFYQRRKHDKWRAVPGPEPALEAPIADSHMHVHMLPDPAWELARCAANGVDFVCMIVDPSEDGMRPFEKLDDWIVRAHDEGQRCLRDADFPILLEEMTKNPVCETREMANAREIVPNHRDNGTGAMQADVPMGVDGRELSRKSNYLTKNRATAENPLLSAVPEVCISVGVHPHNAKLYSPELESRLVERLSDPRVVALGEIGLDFHYDLSPREVQRDVFRRQIELARRADLPLALHLRGGEDPEADNAHREAYDILREMDALGPRALVHCCALSPDELRPWVEAGCYIAYGGALTFKKADAAREGARLVPADRLLLETDAPYMAPEPMRGTACTPAHVIFTAAVLAEVRGVRPGEERRAFLEQVHDNTLRFFGRSMR